jgi:hypothetical protein
MRWFTIVAGFGETAPAAATLKAVAPGAVVMLTNCPAMLSKLLTTPILLLPARVISPAVGALKVMLIGALDPPVATAPKFCGVTVKRASAMPAPPPAVWIAPRRLGRYRRCGSAAAGNAGAADALRHVSRRENLSCAGDIRAAAKAVASAEIRVVVVDRHGEVSGTDVGAAGARAVRDQLSGGIGHIRENQLPGAAGLQSAGTGNRRLNIQRAG